MYSDNTYSNRALIPFWVIHLVFLIIFIAALAVGMMEVAGDLGYEPPALSALMFFYCVALILEPLEMVLQSYRYLEPWVYLGFQIYKVFLSVAFLIYEIYQYTVVGETTTGVWKIVWIITLVLGGLMALGYIASMIYGVKVVRQHKKSSDWDYVKERSGEDDDD